MAQPDLRRALFLASLFTASVGCAEPEEASQVAPWQEAAVVVSLSFHMEGWSFDRDETYDMYREQFLDLAAQGDAHGARFTFESKEFTQASLIRGDDVLLARPG